MSAADPAPIPARLLIERQLGILSRLTDIGMEIAEAAGAGARALAEGGATDGPDPGLTYARAARAVRLTIALQARLLEDLAGLDKAALTARAAEARGRRHRIHRLVDDAIEAARDDEHEIERLSSDAWERLEEADDADLLDRPLAEVVARICRDLGLAPAETVLAAQAFEAEGAGAGAGVIPAPSWAGPSTGDDGPVALALAAVRPAAQARASPADRLG